MAIRNELLDIASKLTAGDRDQEYGDPMVNLACATDLKKVFHGYQRNSGRMISDAEREAIDMVLTKLSRLACGPTAKVDTFVDAACYCAIAGEAFIKEQQGETPTYRFADMLAVYRAGAPLNEKMFGDAKAGEVSASELRLQQAAKAGLNTAPAPAPTRFGKP